MYLLNVCDWIGASLRSLGSLTAAVTTYDAPFAEAASRFTHTLDGGLDVPTAFAVFF